MRRKILYLYKRYKEIINYLIVGLLTTLISVVSYYCLVLTIFNPQISVQLQIANIVSWIVSVAFAYFMNRIFVFESKNSNYIKEAAVFCASRVSTLIMDMAIMFIAVTILKGNDKIAKLFVQIVVIVANYIFSKMYVFRK